MFFFYIIDEARIRKMCRKCGHICKDDEIFCPQCGTKITEIKEEKAIDAKTGDADEGKAEETHSDDTHVFEEPAEFKPVSSHGDYNVADKKEEKNKDSFAPHSIDNQASSNVRVNNPKQLAIIGLIVSFFFGVM